MAHFALDLLNNLPPPYYGTDLRTSTPIHKHSQWKKNTELYILIGRKSTILIYLTISPPPLLWKGRRLLSRSFAPLKFNTGTIRPLFTTHLLRLFVCKILRANCATKFQRGQNVCRSFLIYTFHRVSLRLQESGRHEDSSRMLHYTLIGLRKDLIKLKKTVDYSLIWKCMLLLWQYDWIRYCNCWSSWNLLYCKVEVHEICYIVKLKFM